MKFYVIKLSFFICVVLSPFVYFSRSSENTVKKAPPDFRNFYGITWRGTPHDNLSYAKQMGYEYVFYQRGMENDPLSNGFHFYLETPEYGIYNRTINFKKPHSDTEINFYESYCALKNTTGSFPFNLATGWYFDRYSFTPLLDFQQQRVISWATDSILALVKGIEKRNPNFHFGGFAWDEPRISGDFWEFSPPDKRQVTIANWNGGDYGATAKGAKHEFSTYTEGHLNFYKQLYKSTRLKYPTAKFISEPFNIYDQWLKETDQRSDAKMIMPDILSQEGPGLQFMQDTRIYKSGLIKKQNIYNTTPDVFGEKENRLIAATAAINGSGFGWYGRFGGTGNMPDFRTITQVPARLKLIRVLTAWENGNSTPLSSRTWDGTTYRSNNAFASPNLIAIIQPKTKKMFVVFLTNKSSFIVPSRYKIAAISSTNELFIENGDARSEFSINGNKIKPLKPNTLNQGYIIKLK